jgi:protein involved in polysaccharide export with SLBB domain
MVKLNVFRSRQLFEKIYSFLAFAILVYVFLSLSIPSKAQSLSDVSTINVDQLSDAQVQQLLSRAQAYGLSAEQLYSMAEQRGMSALEVSKLRQRVSQLGTGGQGASSTSQSGGLRQSPEAEGEGLFESVSSTDSLRVGLTEFEKKIFGYSTFHNKNLNFSPNFNMATPQNYVVGPSDQLIIQIYGVAQENYTLTTSPEGKINIPNIGLLHVGGFSIDAVTGLLRRQLSKRFSGLAGPQPNTFLSVTVGNIRTIKVNIVGELKNPGTYTLPSFASVFNGLYAAGGPTTKGTFRNIQVYRAGKLISEIDIYQFLTKGEENRNVMLEDNDVILVRPFDKRVELIGEVRTPGFFEVKSGETISDILFYAGGFTDKAYEELMSVRRNTDVNMKVETILKENYGAFEPRDGDEYMIGEILDRFENRVQISGAVLRPGEYELTDGLTLKQLTELAGGIQGDAFLSRTTIYRSTETFTLRAQSVNLQEIIDGESPDITLKNEDVIHIPSRYDVREEFFVEISGEVNKKGIFPYAENLTVGDLVLRAGGFKEAASSSTIEVARRVRNDASGKIADIYILNVQQDLNLSEEEQNFKLEAFDHVFVRRSPGYREQQLVTIEGEVSYPGAFALENATMRISDLVIRAGGLTQFAYPKGATLVRRNEFYKKPDPNEQLLSNLSKLKRNTERKEIDNSVAEQLLIDRIDDKVKAREDEMLNDIFGMPTDDATDFRLGIKAELAQTSQEEIDDAELIGINLDRIMEQQGSKYDLILQEGDVITVPKELQTVRLRGQVLYPTTTRFDKRRGFKSYIASAGGFNSTASRKKSYVIYANGNVKRTRSFLWVKNYPTLEPGAEIFVPQSPPKAPVSSTLAQFIGLAGTLATTFAVLVGTGVIKLN